MARKVLQLFLHTVKSVLDSHVVVVDKDEEVEGVLMVEVMEDEEEEEETDKGPEPDLWSICSI